MKRLLAKGGMVLISGLAFQLPAQAQDVPEISPSLKNMLGALPIADIRDEVQGMVKALKKTTCGAELKGCYSTKSGPLQLYFFTSQGAQQTFLLVINKKIPLPKLLKDNVQKVLGNTALSDPIISISTADFDLDTVKMPADLQNVVRNSYFNVNSLAFSSGVQLAARADLGGAIKSTMKSLGVNADQLTLRAAVVMPIPTDLVGGAGAGAGLADALRHSDTLKKAGADALKPGAFIEFQFAPNASLPMGMPRMNLTDATFFIDNELIFGYKGNAEYQGVPGKKTIVHFQTPLTPAGAMDLLDFEFRMATPANFTLEDAAHVMVAMASTDRRLAPYGGGFIRNIESFKNSLLMATKPLSVFQLRNPNPAKPYRFGDSQQPFPTDPNQFNVAVLGPLAPDGPFLREVGEVTILGQKMGWLDATAGLSGLHVTAGESISLKLGPLGKVKVRMEAQVDVDAHSQRIGLNGNYLGQAVRVSLSSQSMTIEVPASCANPFEIKTTVALQVNSNLADVFAAEGGVNVNPSTLSGCVGQELEAAYRKIAGEYSHLSGYTASAANAELNKISNAAAKAAADLKKQQEAARQEYEKTKDAAREVADKATSAANNAFKSAGNAFKRFGKKKKHKKQEPTPLFASSVFDWDYYYDNASDSVRSRSDLATHWEQNGFKNGVQGSPEFSARYYWSRYLDVQKLCPNQDLTCAVKHWLDNGVEQGRQGSAGFSIASYLKRSTDLQQTLGKENFEDAMEHWHNEGEAQGRDGRPESVTSGPLMGPLRVGGGGGGAWSDNDTCSGQHVIGWRLLAGRTVDRVQFKYPSYSVGPIKFGGWAPAQGASSDAKATSNVTLTEGEYIVRVDYRAGDRIDSLSFTTNTGITHGPFGGSGGSSGRYTVTPGAKLGCMAGRSGSSTDQLTFTSIGPH